MKHVKIAILLASGLLTAAAAAQAQEKKAEEKKMEMPKPSAEHKKLGYFVGDWRTESDVKPGPWGPGGKMTGDSHCTWMPGGYFVVCHENASGSMGKIQGIGVMGWDAGAKQYTWNGFNSMGENEHAAGTHEGASWVYTTESMMNGKAIKSRYTMTEKSPAAYDFKFETSEDGKTWSSMMEGKVTKKGTEKKM
jgi:hypothetical protein